MTLKRSLEKEVPGPQSAKRQKYNRDPRDEAISELMAKLAKCKGELHVKESMINQLQSASIIDPLTTKFQGMTLEIMKNEVVNTDRAANGNR